MVTWIPAKYDKANLSLVSWGLLHIRQLASLTIVTEEKLHHGLNICLPKDFFILSNRNFLSSVSPLSFLFPPTPPSYSSLLSTHPRLGPMHWISTIPKQKEKRLPYCVQESGTDKNGIERNGQSSMLLQRRLYLATGETEMQSQRCTEIRGKRAWPRLKDPVQAPCGHPSKRRSTDF